MKTYPLKSISVESAKQMQFNLIDCISCHFTGQEILQSGDLGVHALQNMPLTTAKVENVLAQFFNVEEAILVRGAGTNAIKEALYACINESRQIIVHSAPIYSTTKTSLEQLNFEILQVDFNDLVTLEKTIQKNPHFQLALVQYTRQTLSDYYAIEKVIALFKKYKITVISDDNYAVLKVEKIGVQLNADLSCFSCFKLLGPVGIGCVIGKRHFIQKIRAMHYSGGSQVQGYEALAVLRGMIYAPVALAIQAEESEKVVDYFLTQKNQFIKNICIANAQSKVILVEFSAPIALKVLNIAVELGALSHPVGSESIYEFMPLFYKVSGTMLQEDPKAKSYWIRINPMRSGMQTIVRILETAITRATQCF